MRRLWDEYDTISARRDMHEQHGQIEPLPFPRWVSPLLRQPPAPLHRCLVSLGTLLAEELMAPMQP